MNERYGRDYYDDDDNGVREDWDDRSERTNRGQRDFSRGEGGRPNSGPGRNWNQASGERSWGNSGQGRAQYGQGARYENPQYERGEPHSREYGGYGYGSSGGYGSRQSQPSGGYSGGGYSGGGYSGGGYSGGVSRGQYGSFDQSRQSGQGGEYGRSWQNAQWPRPVEGVRREEDWSRNDRFERGGSYGSWREGGFFGKGPKGYTRSDERIREDVCDRLSIDDEVDASDITVTVKAGEVTLDGTVPDRRSKHRAEDIAESVNGVKDVHNSLRPQKGLLQEMGDRVTGRAESEQHGHSGSGPRNSGTTSSNANAQGTSASRL